LTAAVPMKIKSTRPPPGVKEVYLAAYNLVQLLGWACAAYLTVHAAAQHDGKKSVYSQAGRLVSTFLMLELDWYRIHKSLFQGI
jgi:hypothetical protein